MRVLHVGHGFRPFHHGGLIAYTEDLMQAQRAAGLDVAYFFSGRTYWPRLGARLHRWRRDGIAMYEVLNPPAIVGAGDTGTSAPLRDLAAPSVSRHFARLLARVKPDVVHVQELAGLPTTVLEQAADAGVPVVMTLHDYFTLCPTFKLFDHAGQVCERTDPAPTCVACCRDAPSDHRDAVRRTLRFHKETLPLLDRLPGPRTVRAAFGGGAGAPPAAPASAATGDVGAFRARRDVNVERLNAVSRLLAVSPRVAAVYQRLGVSGERMTVLGVTLDHLSDLRPREMTEVKRPVRFITLNGCAARAKGAELVADTLEILAARGRTSADLTLAVAGHVDPAVQERLLASSLCRLTGGYTSADVGGLLDAYDVGVVPSQWEETFGFVGVEMIAKGLPVIGNERGGIPGYTREGESGWLNRSGSAQELADHMETLIDDPSQIVRVNRTICERRGGLVEPMGRHVADLLGVYRELATSSTARSVG